jgi:hypothetical protein
VVRTGTTSESDHYLLPTPPHAVPKPITQMATSRVMATTLLQPMPANVMSPDEMLHVYAERKNSLSATTATVKQPGDVGKRISAAAISYSIPRCYGFSLGDMRCCMMRSKGVVQWLAVETFATPRRRIPVRRPRRRGGRRITLRATVARRAVRRCRRNHMRSMRFGKARRVAYGGAGG